LRRFKKALLIVSAYRLLAVTPEQIELYKLPTRPTKRENNKHAKNFDGDSVELDAIDPIELRRLCQECIERHIDQDIYQRTLAKQAEDIELLKQFAERFEGEAA
jgi:hypothetical protein